MISIQVTQLIFFANKAYFLYNLINSTKPLFIKMIIKLIISQKVAQTIQKVLTRTYMKPENKSSKKLKFLCGCCEMSLNVDW